MRVELRVGLRFSASFLLLGLSVIGCGGPSDETASGKALFEKYCKGCHGGEAQGVFLRGTPSLVASSKSREQIIKMMRTGSHRKQGLKMPAFQKITETQAARLIRHLELMKEARKESR